MKRLIDTVNAPLMCVSDCLPFDENKSCKGSILVLKPEFLIGEFKTVKYQIVLCTADRMNGSPLTIRFIIDNTKCSDYLRRDFFGIIKPWRIPEWVLQLLSGAVKYRKERKEA